MGLRHLARTWNRLAADDPLWAILTREDKAERRWDLDEFLATGRAEVDAALALARRCGAEPARTRALDFGCGVGRLTQALAGHFETVHGVDVAHRMIEEARRINGHGARCVYHVNEAPDLDRFPEHHFDFVYSTLTLQHMPPRLMRGYIAALCRVLAEGGVAVFQVAAAPRGTSSRAGRAYTAVHRWIRTRVLRRPAMDMFGIAPDAVRAIVERAGAAVCAVEADDFAGALWTSFTYVVRRAARTASSQP